VVTPVAARLPARRGTGFHRLLSGSQPPAGLAVIEKCHSGL